MSVAQTYKVLSDDKKHVAFALRSKTLCVCNIQHFNNR